MARFDKSSTKRTKQDAAVAAPRGVKRSTAPSIEDTMFFPGCDATPSGCSSSSLSLSAAAL